MRSIITSSISLFTILVTAAVATNTTQDFQVECSRFPAMIVRNATWDPVAINDLSEALAANSFTPKLPAEGVTLLAGRASPFAFAGNGGYQICVQNHWFFKTLTVSLKDLSQIVAQFATVCCTDANGKGGPPGVGGRLGRCQDARGLVLATDGSQMDVVAQDFGDLCCGLWGCS